MDVKKHSMTYKQWLDHYNRDFRPLFEKEGKSGHKRGLAYPIGQRADGFEILFRELLSNKKAEFQIVETGVARKPEDWAAGQSTVLFLDFIRNFGGLVRSVDKDPKAVELASRYFKRDIKRERFSITRDDSVAWLSSLQDLDKVDLFYLDSHDVDWDYDKPSARATLMEFFEIESFARPGTLIVIDHNNRSITTNNRVGKGRLVAKYLEDKGIVPIYDGHQLIFRI